ncbi:MAG: hypothetical protein H6716_19930 [Polyangiaceae bacterium]|nr:hypothetical protein [Polyangiaceae bacterium]
MQWAFDHELFGGAYLQRMEPAPSEWSTGSDVVLEFVSSSEPDQARGYRFVCGAATEFQLDGEWPKRAAIAEARFLEGSAPFGLALRAGDVTLRIQFEALSVAELGGVGAAVSQRVDSTRYTLDSPRDEWPHVVVRWLDACSLRALALGAPVEDPTQRRFGKWDIAAADGEPVAYLLWHAPTQAGGSHFTLAKAPACGPSVWTQAWRALQHASSDATVRSGECALSPAEASRATLASD